MLQLMTYIDNSNFIIIHSYNCPNHTATKLIVVYMFTLQNHIMRRVTFCLPIVDKVAAFIIR